MKTTAVVGVGLHDVLIGSGQLWEYCRRPLGRQPFYAFPWPAWTGQLAATAYAQGVRVTELAFAGRRAR